MAQTKKRRRKKHRGTQGGGLDRRGPRGRPRTREEARAQAKRRSTDKREYAPSWGSAFKRGLLGAGVFLVLMALLFKQPIGSAVVLSVLMLAMYVPLGYYVDRFFYRRRLRQEQAARIAAKQQRRG